jgi:hypothetical protein
MKYLFLTICIFSNYCISHAQLKKYPTLNIGIAKRPELFELSNYDVRSYRNKGYYFNGFRNLNSPCIVIELNQQLNNKKWALQFSNYFSYNYLYTTIDSNNIEIENINSFKHDYFFDVSYKINLNQLKNYYLLISAGYGRMNIGKKFNYNYPTGNFDANGRQIFRQQTTNLSFTAPRLSVGFMRKKLGLFVTAHGTPDNDLEGNPSLWVEYKILYNIFLKNKASK